MTICDHNAKMHECGQEVSTESQRKPSRPIASANGTLAVGKLLMHVFTEASTVEASVICHDHFTREQTEA